MPKELYLYSPIYDFVAESLISQMNEEGDDSDITMRINSGGGDVFAGYGIAAKMAERKGKTKIKVDGNAMSMAAALLCFGDDNECLDVSTIMLHRAAMPVSSKEDQDFLDSVNEKLREKLKSKIDDKKLKELKGVNIKNLFEDEKRIDLMLSAKEAKQIGLIDKINTLTPKELKAFNDKMYAVAATYVPKKKIKTPKNKIMDKMNVEAFKAKYPKTYAKVFSAGVSAEKERVESCLVFIDVDTKGVKAAIESGKPLNQKQMSEFALKQNSPEMLKKISLEAAAPVSTNASEQVELTDEQKKADQFRNDLKAYRKNTTKK